MKSGIKGALLMALLCSWGLGAYAQDSGAAAPAAPNADNMLNEMSLEDLLNVKVTVASGSKAKGMTTRESPAIVSVITEDDIKRMGAKDMHDVLRYVPGFSPSVGVDTIGSIGVAFRGHHVAEGRMLLQVNGFGFTDLSYSNIPLGHRFPVDLIKRIEIIRGPGSALYGGFAELTVVNIILKDGADVNGNYVSGLYSHLSKDYGRKYLSLGMGKKVGDVETSNFAFLSNANMSDRDWQTETGKEVRFDKESEYSSKFFSTNTTIGNTTVRGIYADYKVMFPDQWLSGPFEDGFDNRWINMGISLTQEHKFMDENLIVTPMVEMVRNKPWNAYSEWLVAPGYFVNDTHDRFRAQLAALYKFNDWSDIMFGVENMHNNTTLAFRWGSFGDVDEQLNFSTLALFAQSTLKFGNINLTIGGRRETTSQSDEEALVPRLGVTAIQGPMHFKLLYSESFRLPTGSQLAFQKSYDLRPEKSKVTELEAGYRLTDKMFLTANFYNIMMSDTIRYQFVSADSQYQNTSEIGSKGAEVEYKWVDSWGNLTATYSRYIATERGYAPQASTLDEKAFIGMPTSKYTLAASYNVTNTFSVNPSVSHQTGFYDQQGANESELDDETIANLNFLYTKAFNVPTLELSVGVSNLFDSDYVYPFSDSSVNPQPPNLPGTPREYSVRASYTF